MTLKELFQSMNLTAYDLTVDMLDVHAVSNKIFFRLFALFPRVPFSRMLFFLRFFLSFVFCLWSWVFLIHPLSSFSSYSSIASFVCCITVLFAHPLPPQISLHRYGVSVFFSIPGENCLQ